MDEELEATAAGCHTFRRRAVVARHKAKREARSLPLGFRLVVTAVNVCPHAARNDLRDLIRLHRAWYAAQL